MSHTQIQKLLLMGPGGAGKTCMRSIIFDNYLPRDALRLGITISLDQSQVRILNSLFLNLWDCGGQHRYVAEYLNRQKEYIFRAVGVMLFVFDINSMSRDLGNLGGGTGGGLAGSGAADAAAVFASGGMTDWTRPEMLEYFRISMRHLREYSPNAKVFVLLHKMDLISPDLRKPIFESRKREILEVVEQEVGGPHVDVDFFATSIWSDSLYLAYSSVVRSLIPHREVLMNAMREVALLCNAAEVALYERSTFLCLTHVTRSTSDGGGGEGTTCRGGSGSNEAITFVADCARQNYEVTAAGNSHMSDDGGELRTTEVSEIIKHFKLSCMNNTASLDGFHMTTTNFTALLHPFTDCTIVLVVSADTSINVELHRLNVDSARRGFIQFLKSANPIAEAMREAVKAPCPARRSVAEGEAAAPHLSLPGHMVVLNSVGHTVGRPALVSTSAGGGKAAYRAGKDRVTLCTPSSTDGVNEVIEFSFSGAEVTFVHLHPTRPLVCIGTEQHGVFVCGASRQLLSPADQLVTNAEDDARDDPSSLRGARVRRALFLHGTSTESSQHADPNCVPQPVAQRTLLVLAYERETPQSVRDTARDVGRSWIRVVDVEARRTLWDGSAPLDLECLAAIPGSNDFVGCTRRNVYLWSPSAEMGDVMSVECRVCCNIDELRGAEYVAVAGGGGTTATFVALTTAGFLICFDRRTGAGLKWMDCKVCPATGVVTTSRYVVVLGALVRFFSVDEWEFCGKVRLENSRRVVSSSYLSNVFRSLCTGASVLSSSAAFFMGNGELLHYELTHPDPAKPAKIAPKKMDHYVPVEPEEANGLLRWLPVSQESEAELMCLWSPQCIRLFSAQLKLLRHYVIETTCAVFHAELQLYLMFSSSCLEVVALDPLLKEVARLPVEEPLVSLAPLSEGRFVGLTPNNVLFYFEGGSAGALNPGSGGVATSLELVSTRKISSLSTPLHELLTVSGTLCAISSQAVVNIGTSAILDIGEELIRCCTAGRHIVVVHGRSVSLVDPDTMQWETVFTQGMLPSSPGSPRIATPSEDTPVDAALSPDASLLAVQLSRQVLVMHLVTGRIAFTYPRKADEFLSNGAAPRGRGKAGHSAVLRSLAFTADGMLLVLCDANGIFSTVRIPPLAHAVPEAAPIGMLGSVSQTGPHKSAVYATESEQISRDAALPPRRSSSATDISAEKAASSVVSSAEDNAGVPAASQRSRRRSTVVAGAPTRDELADRLNTLGDYFKQHQSQREEVSSRGSHIRRCRSASAPRRPDGTTPRDDQSHSGLHAVLDQGAKTVNATATESAATSVARGGLPIGEADRLARSDTETTRGMGRMANGWGDNDWCLASKRTSDAKPRAWDRAEGTRGIRDVGDAEDGDERAAASPAACDEVAVIASSMDTTTNASAHTHRGAEPGGRGDVAVGQRELPAQAASANSRHSLFSDNAPSSIVEVSANTSADTYRPIQLLNGAVPDAEVPQGSREITAMRTPRSPIPTLGEPQRRGDLGVEPDRRWDAQEDHVMINSASTERLSHAVAHHSGSSATLPPAKPLMRGNPPSRVMTAGRPPLNEGERAEAGAPTASPRRVETRPADPGTRPPLDSAMVEPVFTTRQKRHDRRSGADRSKQLRESLLQLRELLVNQWQQNDDNDDDEIGGGSGADDGGDGMAVLVSEVVFALQCQPAWKRAARSDSRGSSVTVLSRVTESGVSRGTTVSSEHLTAVWNELSNLHQQNQRIEEQNNAILQQLSAMQRNQKS